MINKTGKFIGNETGYLERKLTVQALGYTDYNHYLSSDLWKSIKRYVMQTLGNQCTFCENEAETLHHSKYDKNSILGLQFDHMYPVCHSCHESAEYDSEGNKYGPIAALKNMYSKCKSDFGEDYAKLRHEKRRMLLFNLSYNDLLE